jgi:predicted N-formylglutamate amidohydrolase
LLKKPYHNITEHSAQIINMTEEEKSKNIGVESLTPFYDRKVRDVFFIVLFILYWIGMVLIAGIALSQGNLDR